MLEVPFWWKQVAAATDEARKLGVIIRVRMNGEVSIEKKVPKK
jgi:hypothetical protein